MAIFFPCPLGHKLFSSWKHSCLTETLHKKINNKMTQRNQGSCDKTAWCFSFIQLGTSSGLHLLSAKRPGENSRHMEGGVGVGGEKQRKERAKGILQRRNVSSWGWSKEKSRSQRGFNTILCTSLSSPLALCSLPCSHHLPFPFPSQLLCFLSPQAPEITNALKQELACVCAVGPHFVQKFGGAMNAFYFILKHWTLYSCFPLNATLANQFLFYGF